jgi:polysaccharide export outer membrane protein
MHMKITTEIKGFFPALILIFLAVSIVVGQDRSPETPPQKIISESYKIGPGDIIDVIVSKTELSRSGVRVSNLGTIELAMMDNDLTAACLTERQLADAIKEKYRRFLVEPYVSVSVHDFNANPVAVIGAVNSPGRFQLQRTIRLAELLTFVNGTSPNAGNTAQIIRGGQRAYCDGTKFIVPTGEGGGDLITVNLADAFKGDDKANPVIVAGDIVRVSEAEQVAKVSAYIQGSVRSSLAIDLKDPTTLTQAIAMAGGPIEGAQLDKVKIRRQIPGSINRNEIVANVKEITTQKKDDILLQPNDIIEVPGPSGTKKFLNDMTKSFLPMLTSLPMRVIY